jgi:hypothetical protein
LDENAALPLSRDIQEFACAAKGTAGKSGLAAHPLKLGWPFERHDARSAPCRRAEMKCSD